MDDGRIADIVQVHTAYTLLPNYACIGCLSQKQSLCLQGLAQLYTTIIQPNRGMKVRHTPAILPTGWVIDIQ